MPFVTMIAGPNGSGKSTLIAQLVRNGEPLGEYLNADDIARDLTGSAPVVAQAAQIAVRERRLAALAERRDHSFETVMSHSSHIDYLRQARVAGFEIVLYFVATDSPRINEARVANRVAHGGHDVPVDRIRARYDRCLANLPAAIAVAHEGVIFDNSSAKAPLRPLAEIIDGTVAPLASGEPQPGWWQAVGARLPGAVGLT